MRILDLCIFSGLVFVLGSSAKADYVRFWRGHAIPTLPESRMVELVNHRLIPASTALAHTTARLKAYLPVLLTSEASRLTPLPEEVALVVYENEAGYRQYRSTPEGIAYGDLHWEIFERSVSGSLVPGPRSSGSELEPEFEKAYALGTQDFRALGRRAMVFRAYQRGVNLSDAEYKRGVATYLTSVRARAPELAYVLVARDYLLEYIQPGSDHDVFPEMRGILVSEITLEKGVKTLQPGEGLLFKAEQGVH